MLPTEGALGVGFSPVYEICVRPGAFSQKVNLFPPLDLRQLVAKLYLRIKAALARGCEDDDNACSITKTGVKISTATQKQYHSSSQ